MQKNVNGTITNFLWEKDNLAYELDENFNPIRRYVYGMGKDEVKGHVEFSEAQDNVFEEAGLGWYSYIKDQVGSITQVYSRENYSMAETRTYDVFGNLINKTGSSNCNLGFQGKYFDQESGLYYFYQRYYYPTIGRFINEDPIGFAGGLNLYGFVENNPIKWIDPYGLNNEDNVLEDWIEDINEAIRNAKELQERMKKLREMWKRHDEQASIYCPTFKGCLKRCLKAAFGIMDLFITGGAEGMKYSGKKIGLKVLQSAGSVASMTSLITSSALLLYCEIHCGINVRAY